MTKIFTRYAISCFLLATAATATASELELIRSPWQLYVVVSSGMPRSQLVSLAREAGSTGAIMVLNGFPDDDSNFQHAQMKFAELNSECCINRRAPQWVIDPKIPALYHVKSAPSIVLANTSRNAKDSYSVLTGEIDLANTLKYFVRHSRLAEVRQAASVIYKTSFSTD